ncbi:hypothetical protein JCM6294_599 [Bacteroides pyogenes DSM 20611 = JCM 6294]|uniref:Uncharacterized protein n=1 Tax=Bacteroides pyogenes DSM 20611 = JCM 6294 TaxID=1121100 RepID=W4PDD7_9BACE|nr:hypothetical protein JCM6294_599 [Bacteroides pyogenes DSM 20611 = JCM 6294]
MLFSLDKYISLFPLFIDEERSTTGVNNVNRDTRRIIIREMESREGAHIYTLIDTPFPMRIPSRINMNELLNELLCPNY